MPQFTVQLNSDNDDLLDGELQDLLRQVIEQVDAGSDSGVLEDANGSVVGSFTYNS